jgi:hypothetical protein
LEPKHGFSDQNAYKKINWNEPQLLAEVSSNEWMNHQHHDPANKYQQELLLHKPVPPGKRNVPGNGVATALPDCPLTVTLAVVFAAPARRAIQGNRKIVV